jgi:thiol-disulfide isomerase/thioredoxin
MEIFLFKTNNCLACRRMAPVIESAGINPTVIWADTEEGRPQVTEYDVHSVPTFIRLDNGVETKRKVGVMTRRELLAFVE